MSAPPASWKAVLRASWRALRGYQGGGGNTQGRLLTEEAIRVLQRRSSAAHPDWWAPEQEVAHRRSGEARSVYRGIGWDYEESRPYQPGDELRFINWRLSARAGEPYVKVFREERRPSLFIVMDRRAAMRFGTRRRLKVTQAARLAALETFYATRGNMAVGGVLLERRPSWIPERSGQTAAMETVRAMAAPCPSATGVGETPLVELLKFVQARLVQGTRVLILSDFADVGADELGPLLALARRHPVRAAVLVDPAELALPDAGRVTLESVQGDAVDVDTSDTALRQTYARLAGDSLDRRRRTLGAAGFQVRTIMTDDELGTATP